MADIKFECPECKQPLAIEAGNAGMDIQCPICSKAIKVPEVVDNDLPQPNRKFNYSGLGKRFSAGLIDYAVSIIPLWLMEQMFGDNLIPLILYGWLYFAILLSSSWQATLGMKCLKIMLTDDRGGRISFGRATGRYFASLLSGALFFLGFLIIPFTKRKQGLHDMIGGTIVCQTNVGSCIFEKAYRFPFARILSLRNVAILVCGMIIVLVCLAILFNVTIGDSLQDPNTVTTSTSGNSVQQNVTFIKPIVDPAETERVWNQFVDIENALKDASPNEPVESINTAIVGLQLLNSTSGKADPKLTDLIDRFINWLQDYLSFYNGASEIVQEDPNNQDPSTIPARMQSEKSLEDIFSEANTLDEFQKKLRIELQNKYNIQLDDF